MIVGSPGPHSKSPSSSVFLDATFENDTNVPLSPACPDGPTPRQYLGLPSGHPNRNRPRARVAQYNCAFSSSSALKQAAYEKLSDYPSPGPASYPADNLVMLMILTWVIPCGLVRSHQGSRGPALGRAGLWAMRPMQEHPGVPQEHTSGPHAVAM